MTHLVDTHCHLDFESLAEDRAGVFARATEADVGWMVSIGCATSVDDVGQALAIAKAHPNRVRCTVGVHPHDAAKLDEALMDALGREAEDALVVAVGEMGLDFHYDNSPRDAQREAFRKQIALARSVKKPIVVHTRNAADETLAILREENARDVGGIIHCFSETPDFAKAALDLGFVASFSGLVTFPRNADAIREAARVQPADALLLETDSPYLSPVPKRGKPNEPSYVKHTALAIAELRGEDRESFFESTTANAARILGLPSYAPPKS